MRHLSFNNGKTRQDADILILGAGAAGIAAARALHDAGLKVITLEARRRLGGRVYTDYSLASHPIELGAEFIHGRKAQTWRYMDAFGLSAIPDANHGCYFLHDKLIQDGKAPLPACEELMSHLKAKARAHLAKGKPDVSIRRFLDSQRGYPLGPSFGDNIRLVNNLIASEKGADIHVMSLSGLLEHDFSGYGDHNYRIEEGYARLLKRLARGLDIRGRQAVRRIKWGKKGVVLRCTDGLLRARQAVITLPLGVLQAGDVEFDPPLPDKKRIAIKRLGAAAVCKVMLRFRKEFWPDSMAILATTGDTQVWWPSGWGRTDAGPILTGLIGGEAARRFTATKDTAIPACLAQLQTMFRRDVGRLFVQGRMVHWHRKRFSKMGYSFLPVGSSPALRDQLAEPVADTLFFAGEATNRSQPSTVHGALQSGVRAARQVLELTASSGSRLSGSSARIRMLV